MWMAPTIGFGSIWFLFALAPVSNIIPMSMLMGERFLYIPLAGFCITFAALFDNYYPKGRSSRRILNGCACIVLITLGFLTAAKNQSWRDPEVLWAQSLERYPDSYRARMGLAAAYYESGQTLEAIKQYGYALRLFPNMQVLHDLGNAYRQIGDFPSAVGAYNSALALDPRSSWTRTSLAITYLLQGKTEEAIKELQHAIKLEGKYWIAHYYLGLALEDKGDLGAALQELKVAFAYAPERNDVRVKINELERRLREKSIEAN
jgi:tetratricopeptide (TPR) repeat protein